MVGEVGCGRLGCDAGPLSLGAGSAAALVLSFAVTPRQSALDQAAQPARWRLALGDKFGGVLVAQFVQGERAALGHRQGFGEQGGRVAAGEGVALVQALLGVGGQRQPGLGHAAVQAQRSHQIGDRTAGGTVHQCAAGGKRRDAGGAGDAA